MGYQESATAPSKIQSASSRMARLTNCLFIPYGDYGPIERIGPALILSDVLPVPLSEHGKEQLSIVPARNRSSAEEVFLRPATFIGDTVDRCRSRLPAHGIRDLARRRFAWH